MWTLFFIFIFFIAGIGLLIQNSFSILFGVLGTIALAILLFKLADKWPGITISCFLLFIIVVLIYFVNIDTITQNRQQVEIYVSTSSCVVWAAEYDGDDDYDYRNIVIPKGAVVARYDEPGVMEEIYAPMVSYCFDGQVYTYKMGVSSQLEGKNTWNIEKLKVISYREFSDNTWWEVKLP